MVAPWAPSEYPDFPMIKVNNAPAVQMDFSRVLEVDQEPFDSSDCDIYGDSETTIGIKLCITEESAGTLRAGMCFFFFFLIKYQKTSTANQYLRY